MFVFISDKFSIEVNFYVVSIMQRWKFSSHQLISSFLNKIFRNTMFQAWSRQLENEGIWGLYRGILLFSSESIFFSDYDKIMKRKSKQW